MPGSFFEWRGRIGLRNLQRPLPHFSVNGAVGRENRRPAQAVGLTCEIADPAAGLFDQERAGGGVPFLPAEFPEAIEAARGHASEIERSGAITPHAVGALRKIPVVMKIGISRWFVCRRVRA